MKRTIATTLALFVLLVPAVAHATPTDDAESSQTIWVAWKMPGPFQGYATWPQTYLPNGVPECGEGGVQVDEYKYGTEGIREKVHALLESGVLNSPADDARVATRNFYFVALEPCESPSELPEIIDPVVLPTVQTDVLPSGPAAGAVPVVMQPTYTG